MAIYNEAIINSKILANHFRVLCEDFSSPFKEETSFTINAKCESNKKVLHFITQMQRLVKEGKCDAQTFQQEVMEFKNLNIVHLEILWYMEVFKFITLKDVIIHHEQNQNTEFIKRISQMIFENLVEYKNGKSQLRKQMLVDCLKTVLCNSQDDTTLSSTFKKQTIYSAVLNFIVLNLKEFYDGKFEILIEKILDISSVIEILDNTKIDNSIIKNFFQQILCSLLQTDVIQSTKTILQKQENLKNNVKDVKIYNFFTLIYRYLSSNDAITHLNILFYESSRAINWDYMLPFIIFLGNNYKDGWNLLKILSNSLIKTSFQNFDVKLLMSGFLIARQGCFEKSSHLFPSYLQWFASTFSAESSRPITSMKVCTFFFCFLSDLVAYDDPYYLKVHINRIPWVPMDCQSQVTEYITLVKTQLCDLNVSAELGICENTTGKSAAVFDVESVIRHFEKTSNILSSVFQASMFCRGYYENKFLVVLLSKFEGTKSSRHKIILKLHSQGKIPETMFKKYKKLQKKP